MLLWNACFEKGARLDEQVRNSGISRMIGEECNPYNYSMGSKTEFLGECLKKCAVSFRGGVNKKNVLWVMALFAIIGVSFNLESLTPDIYAQAFEADSDDFENISVKEMIKEDEIAMLVSKEEPTQCENKAGEVMKAEVEKESNDFENKLYDVVGNAPIKEMVPFIAKHDQRVAALIVGIAKKESNWGHASPSKNGSTCYNYWGYKGAGSRGTAMGYGCFASAEEGVNVIGKRIGELVNKNLNTPSKMVVWKCGSAACAGHDPQSVRKWISDVDMYYRKVVTVEG